MNNTQADYQWSTRDGLRVTYYCLTYEGGRAKHSHYEFSTERNAIASQKQWETSSAAKGEA